MPSRKRNKGKDRKAKKAEMEARKIHNETMEVRSLWKSWARGDIDGQSIIECNHGIALTIPDDENHPVCSFMDTFHLNLLINRKHIVENLGDTYTHHSHDVWNNESHRTMAAGILLSIGTNLLLGTGQCQTLDSPRDIAHAILCLENYDGGRFRTIIQPPHVAKKVRDLYWCGSSDNARRDVLKFYRKRSSCSCLKRMHLNSRKTLPKVGLCYHCKEVKERSLLMVCGRCRVSQYCSRECQIAHWHAHKEDCEIEHQSSQSSSQPGQQQQQQQQQKAKFHLTPEAKVALREAVLSAIRHPQGTVDPACLQRAKAQGLPEKAILNAARVARQRI